MNEKKTDQLLQTLLAGSALIVLAGAIMQLQHYSYGELIFVLGVAAWFILTAIKVRIRRRRKRTNNQQVENTNERN